MHSMEVLTENEHFAFLTFAIKQADRGLVCAGGPGLQGEPSVDSQT